MREQNIHPSQNMAENYNLLQAVMEGTTDAIFVKDLQGRYLMINRAGAGALGKRAEEILGKDDSELFSAQDARQLMEEDRQIIASGDTYTTEDTRTCAGGRTQTYLVTKGPYRDDKGNIAGTFGIARDITERKQGEEALREAEERFRSAFENAPIGVALLSLGRRYLRVNHSLCEMLGYSEEHLLAKTSPDITYPEDLEISRIYVDRVLEGRVPKYNLEKRYVHAEGHLVWSLLNVSLVRDSQGNPNHFVAQYQDITERKALEKQLEHQAFHDSLTDLPNRALFSDRLKHALARAKRRQQGVALLFMDLDNFKYVNDSLGHEAGDRLLVGVAERLKKSARPEDTIARLGGDEFTLLLEDIEGVEDSAQVAERVTEVLREPFYVQGHELFAPTSIGITFSAAGEEGAEALLRQADLALYDAKRAGKAHYAVFDPATELRSIRRLRLENDLRRAVEREEFILHYQPLVSLKTRRVVDMEALVRWKHPERGLVSPYEFVPVAEEIGLIVPLGRWALYEACRKMRQWQERYPYNDPPLSVSVNLSGRQLRAPDLVGDVEGALKQSGLEPERLTLEVTESVLVEDAGRHVDTLQRLSNLGVTLAIDDFGTGYSSLSYLRRLPAGILKVAGPFVEGIGTGSEDEFLLAGIISIARGLGLQVAAEGVESAQQAARLEELGCDLAQGYHFSRALPEERASQFLGQNIPR